jgi:hypothetical protein
MISGMSAYGPKQTSASALHMSAFDPKRTLVKLASMTALLAQYTCRCA